MRIICSLALLWISHSFAGPIETANDLAAESALAVSEGKVYLLYVSRIACPYCTRLEKNVLFPMLRNDDYRPLVDLHELAWESNDVIDFDRQARSAAEIIARFKIMGTPTLLFLDGQGNELTDRISGYHSEDFYWYYFDKAIGVARGELDGN